jgi:excisionase family DNA binding protein
VSNLAEPLLTVQEVAALLKLDEQTVSRMAQRGKLPGYKIAGKWRFSLIALEEFLRMPMRKPGGEASA